MYKNITPKSPLFDSYNVQVVNAVKLFKQNLDFPCFASVLCDFPCVSPEDNVDLYSRLKNGPGR